jgi:hypothetical protein
MSQQPKTTTPAKQNQADWGAKYVNKADNVIKSPTYHYQKEDAYKAKILRQSDFLAACLEFVCDALKQPGPIPNQSA